MTHTASFDLSGRIALVTGSTSGIGRSIAEGLAQAGAHVVINARTAPRVEETVDALRAAGLAASAMPFDVTDPPAAQAAVARIEAEVGPITILVNNAGIQRRGRLDQYEESAWRELMATNLDSLFFVSKPVAQRMIPRGYGKIINIGSVMSDLARPTTAAYTAAKGAVRNLTRGMAIDWGPLGIRANAIGPGYFRSELTQSLVDDPAFTGWLKGRTPLGRWGDPDELKGAAVFLASPASDFVTGAMLYVDGGLTASV